MLFSCLVDADYLDTEAFYDRVEGRPTRRAAPPALAELKAKLDAYLADLAAQADDTLVNRERATILAACREAAAERPGLFTLTVPTGGGKTLASLAFALEHALAHGLERVIYVIPYTSIIEQNAAVFREALGAEAVLEHHSAFIDDPKTAPEAQDKLRLAMENWDAPWSSPPPCSSSNACSPTGRPAAASCTTSPERRHPRRGADAAAAAAPAVRRGARRARPQLRHERRAVHGDPASPHRD